MNDLMETSNLNIANTYGRYPFLIKSGKDVKVFDEDGNPYYDMFAGISVCNLGHCNDEIVDAVKNQAEKLFHACNLFYTKPQIELAEKITASSFSDRVFFSNSGAEANEAAIKLARKYGADNYGTHKNRIITFKGSFHGRTLGTLAATGQDKIKKGFGPDLDGFDYAEFGNLESVRELITENTCAIMIEPVQGEGGINIPDPEFLKELKKLCEENHLLLIFDEIQTGMGRTGALFAYEKFGVVPDIITLAKALGNGLPIGCMAASNFVMESFGLGSHGSTFGGNPIACAAGSKVMDIMTRDGFFDEIDKKGKYFLDLLKKLKEKHKIIKDARGIGLLIGLELEKIDDPMDLLLRFSNKGFLINIIQGNIIRLAPPLTIEKGAIEKFVEAADMIFNDI